MKQRYGPVVGLLLGGERILLVSDRDAVRIILIDQVKIWYTRMSRPMCHFFWINGGVVSSSWLLSSSP
jgi:hypothetical protein